MLTALGYLLGLIIIGLILLARGKIYFKPLIIITTFFVVYNFYIAYGGISTKDIAIGALSGIIFSLLSIFIVKIGLFFSGIMAGGAISSLALSYLPENFDKYKIFIAAGIILVLGFLAVKVKDVIIILCTSAIGAYLAGVAGLYLIINFRRLALLELDKLDFFQSIKELNVIVFKNFILLQHGLVSITFIILFIFGVIIQFRWRK